MGLTVSQAWSVLGLSPGASPSDVRRAYRQRALQTHPDRGGTDAAFTQVREAYELLSGPQSTSPSQGVPPADSEDESTIDLGAVLYVREMWFDGVRYEGRARAQVTSAEEELVIAVSLEPGHAGGTGEVVASLSETPEGLVTVFQKPVLQRSCDRQNRVVSFTFSPLEVRTRLDGHPVGWKPEVPPPKRPWSPPPRAARTYRTSRFDSELFDPDLPWTWWGW